MIKGTSSSSSSSGFTPFDLTKRINVSGYQSDCGANVFLHFLFDHWDTLDFGHPLYTALLNIFSDSVQGQLMPTKDQMHASMASLMNPVDREIAFGPLIRKHIAQTIKNDTSNNNEYRNSWIAERAVAPEGGMPADFDQYHEQLANGHIPFDVTELRLYALKMGINLDVFQASGQQYGEKQELPGSELNLVLFHNAGHYQYFAHWLNMAEIEKRRALFASHPATGIFKGPSPAVHAYLLKSRLPEKAAPKAKALDEDFAKTLVQSRKEAIDEHNFLFNLALTMSLSDSLAENLNVAPSSSSSSSSHRATRVGGQKPLF